MSTPGVVYGKVHPPGDGRGIVCRLEVTGDSVVATELKPAEGESPREFTFPLRGSDLSFGGSGDCKLILETGKGDDALTLYAERSDLEAPLSASGIASIQQALGAAHAAQGSKKRGALALFAAVLVALILGTWGAVVAANWAVDRALAMVPPSWEVKLGDALVSGFVEEGKAVEDPAVKAVVDTITSRITAAVGETPYPLKFHLVKDSTVNAFALPGGNMIILTGLLTEAGSPEEVAGVVSHEIQHVLQRHSLKNIFHHLKWRLLLSMVVGDLETMSDLVLAKATGLIELSFGRDMEREADIRGVELLVKADIDPRGLERFFKHLAEKQGKMADRLAIISTHPASTERVQYLDELIRRVGDRAYRPLDVDWEGMQQKLKEGTSE